MKIQLKYSALKASAHGQCSTFGPRQVFIFRSNAMKSPKTKLAILIPAFFRFCASHPDLSEVYQPLVIDQLSWPVSAIVQLSTR